MLSPGPGQYPPSQSDWDHISIFHAGNSCLHCYSCCFPKSEHLSIHSILPTDMSCCLQKLVVWLSF